MAKIIANNLSKIYKIKMNRQMAKVQKLQNPSAKLPKYIEIPAVNGISFEVKDGEIFGLLGPNGAGKTTTIGMLTTRIRPTSGELSVDGFDVVKDAVNVKSKIAVVPQQTNLDRQLTPREILYFHARYFGVSRQESKEKAGEVLKFLQLEMRADEKVELYSGGMAQRLLLGRALMHNPKILYLDEPTANLDPQTKLLLWDKFRELHRQNVTILLTTHNMNEAQSLCDRIAIIDHGKIIAIGTLEELRKQLPGGNLFEVKVNLADDEDLEDIRRFDIVEKLDIIKEHDYSLLRVYSNAEDDFSSTLFKLLQKNNNNVISMNFRKANLETLFLHLTGKELRE